MRHNKSLYCGRKTNSRLGRRSSNGQGQGVTKHVSKSQKLSLPEDRPSSPCIRVCLLLCCCFCCAVGIFLRLHYLQHSQHEKWERIAESQHDTQIVVQGARGSVFDRRGRSMAVSVPASAIGVHPRKISN